MNLLLSPIVRAGTILAVLAGAFFAWLMAHDAKIEDRVIVKVEKKANANAEIANEVRSSDGKGGRPDPFLRKP